jgi:hypothetical protein
MVLRKNARHVLQHEELKMLLLLVLLLLLLTMRMMWSHSSSDKKPLIKKARGCQDSCSISPRHVSCKTTW